MSRGTQHIHHHKKAPARKHRFSPAARGNGSACVNVFEEALTCFPDALVLCDREERVLWMNQAALTLFAADSAHQYLGIPYQQLSHHYDILADAGQHLDWREWLPRLHFDEGNDWSLHENLLQFRAYSGERIYLNLCYSFQQGSRRIGMIAAFHEITRQYQRVLHLRRVQEVVQTLIGTISHIPRRTDLAGQEEPLLLSHAVAFIAQQLVKVVHHVLECHRLLLLGFEPPAGHLYYVASSGFSADAEQSFRENRGRHFLSDFFDDTIIVRLRAGQNVVIPAQNLRFPPWFPSRPEHLNDLLIPLVLEQQWVGILSIAKNGSTSDYTEEEMALAHAAVTQALLIMECAHGLVASAEARGRELLLEEANRLSKDFLPLAAHELRTPLTTIKGNLQLAQRRLQTLKRLISEQLDQFELVQRALTAVTQGTQRQERMIQDLLDDACIQAQRLDLSLHRCDLLALVQETVARWRRTTPERALELEVPNPERPVLILADADRIKRVLDRYIENALIATPTPPRVIVRMDVEGTIARVSVHHEGAGIPLEEQEQIWERSYQAQGSGVPHAFDLSLGLGLYLSRIFIERHQGRTGVYSTPEQGTTFWFTVPLASSSGEYR